MLSRRHLLYAGVSLGVLAMFYRSRNTSADPRPGPFEITKTDDEWRKVLTPEMQEQFDRTAEVTKQAAVQTHTVTQVDVTHIGVSMLDDSRAEVAAYINVSATGDGIAQGSAAAPLRVRMERIDGRWLVSELTDS